MRGTMIFSELFRGICIGLSYIRNRSQARFLLSAAISPSTLVHYGKIRAKKGCTLEIDESCQIDGSIIFDRENASVVIGKRVFMNGTIIAAEKVSLGSDILVSWGVTIVDHDSHSTSFSKRTDDVLLWREHKKDWSPVKISPVTIGDKVWIGFNSIILCGITIGEGAVIGAGSVVTHDIPAWSVAAGNPARIIREIPIDER